MGPRTRRGGAALIAALLLTFVSAVAPGGARPRAPSAASTSPVVSPFFIVPVPKPNRPTTLTRLRIDAVTPGGRVLSACSACGATKFVKTLGAHRVTLSASRPLRMRANTRVVVGVIFPGWTGRWIVLGFRRHKYRGLGHGCMRSTVTRLTPADAAHPSAIRRAGCGPSSPPGAEYVYWNGPGDQLLEEPYFPKRWHQAEPIGSGNAVASAPTAVVRSSGERDVFWKGSNGRLYEMTYTGFWSNANELQTNGTLESAPSAAVDKRDVVHVFWKSTDGGFVQQMSETGGVWSQPLPVNTGPVGSAPAVVVRPDGSLDLFWKGTDGLLWEKHPGEGAKKRPGAGLLDSAPTGVFDGHGHEHVFWRGTDEWLWEITDPDSPRSVSHRIDRSGRIGSAPSAVIHSSQVQDLFWKGTDGWLWEISWFLGNWHPKRVPLSGTLGSQPAAALGQ